MKSGFHAERESEFHARSIPPTSGKQNSWSDDVLSQARLIIVDTSENRNPIRTPRMIREKNLALDKLNSPVEVYDPLGRQLLQTMPQGNRKNICAIINLRPAI